MCVRRNAHHRELELPESMRCVLNTVLMVAVSTCGPIGCPVSPPSLSSQNVQSHENSYTNYSARGETPTISLALDTKVRAGRESRLKLVGYSVAE